MAKYDTSVDLSLLESLDFPVECGHSQHESGDFTHDGPAEFIAVSYHDCPARPDSPPPYYYPCCAVWAAYVTVSGQLGRTMMCSRCGAQGKWTDFVNILDEL
jgi:hypothetical protein